MERDDFIKKFAEQFDETEANTFTSETKFRELDEWSSLMALSIIAMVDDEYDVTLKGDDIRSSETIADIYDKVVAKLK